MEGGKPGWYDALNGLPGLLDQMARDVATARDLLNEVAAGNDMTARDEALQLLRDIG